MKTTAKSNGVITLIIMSLIAVAIFANFSVADPEGVTPSYISNSTKNSTAPGSRTDPGGYIYTITMNVTQQNVRWKAYVGNISGRFTLDDANGNTIYDWDILETSVTGEVFATRNDSITWQNIGCAETTIVDTEDSSMGFTALSTDSINNTFNNAAHSQFLVAGTTITNSTCPSIATFVNDTSQTEDESALFQEVLLDDDNFMIYAAIMEQDAPGYQAGANENVTYDFQMIVADNETASTPTEYFFYVELG